MKGYMSAREASYKWGVSESRVHKLCQQGRIPGLERFGRSWVIPENAEKPEDPRIMKSMDGLLFLREVQKNSPKTNIVISTAYEECVVEAVRMQIRLAGYLSLPVTISKIGKLIRNILSQMKVAEAG